MPATTGGPNVLQDNIYYIGYSKQAVWGTEVAPTVFSHWLDGTDASPQASVKTEREGDTSPFITLAYKQRQMWAIKIVEYVRPITIGYVLEALLGSGSDAFTAPTLSTTFNAATTVGATSFVTVASIGNVGASVPFNFTPGFASAVYEVQNVNLASRTGTGPYTYNLVAGAAFSFAHSGGDTINNASSHFLTRQTAPYDAYSMEIGRGTIATFGDVTRVLNCVCTSVVLTSTVGMPLKCESTWVGSFSDIKAAATAISLEGAGLIGSAGSPLVHFMAGSTWNLDGQGAGIGLGAGIKSLKLTLKNSTKPEDMQSELLYAPYFVPGVFDIDAELVAIFESYNQYKNTYYGAPGVTTGANDSFVVGYGSLGVTWSSDGINSLALSLPNVAYTAATLQPPKRDGQIVPQPIKISGQRLPAGANNPVAFTLSNSSAVQY